MRWATRAGVHIDRASSAWLIRKFIDPDAELEFVEGPEDVDDEVIPFDMRGVQFGHHGEDCTFETLLWRIAAIVHEADLEDGRYDGPEAAGLDVVLRGLSMVCPDAVVIELTGPVFDGLYECFKRSLLLGTEPA